MPSHTVSKPKGLEWDPEFAFLKVPQEGYWSRTRLWEAFISPEIPERIIVSLKTFWKKSALSHVTTRSGPNSSNTSQLSRWLPAQLQSVPFSHCDLWALQTGKGQRCCWQTDRQTVGHVEKLPSCSSACWSSAPGSHSSKDGRQRPKNPLKTTPKPHHKVDSNPYQLQARVSQWPWPLKSWEVPKEAARFLPSPAARCSTHSKGTFHQFCRPKNFFPQVQDVADSSLKATLI